MTVSSAQLGLFESDHGADGAQAVLARARMRATIDRLDALSMPTWTNDTAVIMEDGAFRRAMQWVPVDEAQTLWAEFDRQMQRLYAIWIETAPSTQK
jgi:aspartate/tyrosine/aromatic aminotransferase